ncbi:hypothetical protein CA598_31380, partial [Paenibacillus sp. VTT E-133291]
GMIVSCMGMIVIAVIVIGVLHVYMFNLRVVIILVLIHDLPPIYLQQDSICMRAQRYSKAPDHNNI